ncbi:putative invertase inhibitor [Silene latifolia]|uniref:putative invertase inhibitor n=1 Tax=Silene latifolia TaxID=37657 RepID=UPI003D771A75
MMRYIVSLILLFLFLSTVANAVNLVPQTCSKIAQSEPNVKYDFCVKALGSDPRSSTASLEELAEISFKLTISKAKSISKLIGNLLKNPKFDPFQKNALEACQELYADVPEDMDSGLKALKERDFNTANVEVSGVITSADTCEDGFRERKEFSPWTKQNSDFMELTDISLVFTNLLK